MFDRVTGGPRRHFLITHPIADVDSYNVIRWSPGSQLSSKSIGLSGKLFTNPGGNGVSLKFVNWKHANTPVALDALYLEQGLKGTSAHQSEFVVHINPGDLGKHVDIAIGNNGNFTCDATALRLRVRKRQAVRNPGGRYQKVQLCSRQVQNGPRKRTAFGIRPGQETLKPECRHGR
jgi:hypothetical protein